MGQYLWAIRIKDKPIMGQLHGFFAALFGGGVGGGRLVNDGAGFLGLASHGLYLPLLFPVGVTSPWYGERPAYECAPGEFSGGIIDQGKRALHPPDGV